MSRTIVTSAMPTADALVGAGEDHVLALARLRSARPCSPSAQRSASARLLLPEPLGPTTALIPPPNSTSVRSANDLKPWRRSARRRGGRAHRDVTRPPGRRRRGRTSRTAPIASPGSPRAPGARPRSPRSAGTAPPRRRAPGRRPRPRCGRASRGPGRSRRGSGSRAGLPSVAGCTPGGGSWGSSAAGSASRSRAPARRASSARFARCPSPGRGRSPRTAPRTPRRAARAGARPPRWASPSPRSRYDAQVDPVRRAARGRSSRRSTARRVERSPSSSVG